LCSRLCDHWTKKFNTLEAYKHRKRNRDGGHDYFLLNWNVGCTKRTADLALIASRLSQGLLRESFTSIRWLSSKVEAWNFAKSVRNYSLKKRQKHGRLVNDALKTMVIKYFNVKAWLLFAPPYLNFWLRAC